MGAGAGFAGDRIDPAVQLARHADLDYLVFECLGERTVAAAQARRMVDPDTGFDPLLEKRMQAVLTDCRTNGTTIITNSGAANPAAAGELVVRVAADLGLSGLRVAVITGDDVLEQVRKVDPLVWETGEPASLLSGLVSANAYLGADALLPALRNKADVVITGRVSDPSLYLSALIHEFGWALDDFERLGKGTLVGHLLECAGQLTGGYFADPVTKPVPGMAHLGFPFADVREDGVATLRKLADSGGRLDRRTCAEQLLYEVDDPTAYLTPDVTADFSSVTLDEVGPDAVRVDGAGGRERPAELKVSIGVDSGWVGEGQMTYAGPRCQQRAELAAEIVRARLVDVHGLAESAIVVEIIGAGAAFRGLGSRPSDATGPAEVRLRVSATSCDLDQAEAVAWEVESLYTNGPAGGGGARGSTTAGLQLYSCLLPRELITTTVQILETP